MKKSKIYDPKKCQHTLVAQIEDSFGNKIALIKHHAFAWSVIKETNGAIKVIALPREEAKKEYKKLKKLIK